MGWTPFILLIVTYYIPCKEFHQVASGLDVKQQRQPDQSVYMQPLLNSFWPATNINQTELSYPFILSMKLVAFNAEISLLDTSMTITWEIKWIKIQIDLVEKISLLQH